MSGVAVITKLIMLVRLRTSIVLCYCSLRGRAEGSGGEINLNYYRRKKMLVM